MACRSSHKVAANAAKGSSGSEGVSGGDPPHERFSVAPMMDVTDNHFRQMCRILSKHAVLYTEMVVDNTIINNRERMEKHLAFPPEQRPVALQMGGSDPIQLREAARVASEFGYDAINLNCGCPSPRVSTGCFGAALMKDPHLVAECAKAIEEGSGIPPSVKCRLGVDDHDSYEELRDFVSVVSSCSPTRLFIIHARKAHLRGLNPAQNRTVPPLKHEWVTHLAREFPHLRFVLNGGIRSIDEAKSALDGSPEVEGVMLGRAVSNEPWNTLSRVDVSLFGEASPPVPSRRQVIREYCEYADRVRGSVVWNEEDAYIVPSVRQLVMPLMSLFHGVPRVRSLSQHLKKFHPLFARVRPAGQKAMPERGKKTEC